MLSATGADAAARRHPFDPRRLTGVLLAVLAIATGILLLSTDPHVFVALTSDRDGRPLLPASTLAPGSATTGELTLANEGLLPLRYDLTVKGGQQEMASGVVIRIRRQGAANYLYQGPISSRPIPIGTLLPGRRDHLEVTLAALPGDATSSLPVDDTFVWTAHSPGIASWWWLLLVAAALVVAAFLFPRLVDLAARLRRVTPRPPFELFWRAPLILAAVLVATLVPLTGVTLSTVNAQSSNPGNVFAIGALVLSDTAPARAACLSVGSLQSQTGAPGRCDAIFTFANQAPGDTGTARVGIRNVGTAPVRTFTLWTTGCASQAAGAFHGGGDACSGVAMTIHDDAHQSCVYPVAQAGACPPPASGATLRDFATAHHQAAPLALNPLGLGSGITYTFTVAALPGDGNAYQGLAAVIDLDWEVSQ